MKSAHNAQTNLFRLSCSVTSFPFQDPSPSESDARLLGLRFDIRDRDGKFDNPYYILLKRTEEGSLVRIYRHTIPAFIPVRELEDQCLPRPEQSSNSAEGQDLHKLVQRVRQELVSWHLRKEAIERINDQLGLKSRAGPIEAQEPLDSLLEHEQQSSDGHGVVSIQPTSVEAEYVRVQWRDGKLGRIKLSNSGDLDRCVIYGDDGRVKEVEDFLMDGKAHVKELGNRLKLLHQRQT